MRSETYCKHERFGVVGTYDVREAPPKPGARGSLKWRDANHTPHNKRAREVEATAELVVTDMPDGHNTMHNGETSPARGWTQFHLTEWIKHKSGKQTSKTISVVLSSEARAALLDYLTREGAGG